MINASEDSGCLSVLSSCFKRRGKPRPGASECPNQVAPLVSSATEVTELSSLNPVHDETSASTNPEIQTPRQKAHLRHHATTILGLWQEAYDKLDEKTRKWIDSIPRAANSKDSAKELVELVRLREKHEKEALKLKFGGRQILRRDYATRVIFLLTAIGDITVTVTGALFNRVVSSQDAFEAQTSARQPYELTIFQANVSKREDLVAIMGCTDMVLCLVRRGMVYEEVYLRELPRLPAQEDLKQELVEVYANCLEFLAFVGGELQHGNMRRFLEAFLDPGHGDKRVSALKALEQKLQFAAQACEAEASSEHRNLVQSLAWPLKRVDDNVAAVLERLNDKEKEKGYGIHQHCPSRGSPQRETRK
ncbi:hypothetical protein GCG54_00006341 [Colletotrichum gloeosporioides]|uniref:Uncharacterized protein n=1 Tax=Colletotrichum gloeosporioides TaxID=474922 RepID=A0A8H4CR04_COLGL|nr:uncharacterized protein GCG54_00006341 [Colletotrichum gloeosporioides]KAF3808479.1 hypothetical protein GCG54_00006341 [Colletotrichum gloeosporioides]